MTTEQNLSALVDEAERLSAGATPGPWEVKAWDETQRLVCGERSFVAKTVAGNDDANAAFLASARTLVPALAAAVRRLEQERNAARKQAAEWEVQAQDFRDRLVKAEEFLRGVTLERDHAQRVEVTDALLRAEAAEKRLADLRTDIAALTRYKASDYRHCEEHDQGDYLDRSEVIALVSP